MNSQAIARILLVIILIVAAHIIKPFSVKNITYHLIHTSESFVSILPDSLQSRFNQANQLAMAFSQSLFENGQNVRNWSRDEVEARMVVADLQNLADKKMAPSAEAAAPKVVIKYRVLAKRTVRSGEIRNLAMIPVEVNKLTIIDDMSSNGETEAPALSEGPDELEMPVRTFNSSMPVVLPSVKVGLNYPLTIIPTFKIERHWIKPIPMRIEMLSLPKRPSCNQSSNDQETKEVKLIALFDEVKRRSKTEVSKLNKALTVILKCETGEGVNGIERQSAPAQEESNSNSDEIVPMIVRPQAHQFENGLMEP